ncbi:hypothetical protein ABTZ03_26145 [Kitasatospora sp. NPDC096077]|uniref:hypothetical protein n=1 Tax=Kitasatospora sp. NPDC096077 TaxID=3155544 RepID=UPI00331BD14A
MSRPLVGLDLRATTLTTRIAALVRDTGTGGQKFLDRAAVLDAEVRASDVRAARTTLALAFHHAVLDDDHGLDHAIRDLDQLTRGHNYDYDIAAFMASRELQYPSPARRRQDFTWAEIKKIDRAIDHGERTITLTSTDREITLDLPPGHR